MTKEQADQIAAQLAHAAPGIDVASLAVDVYNGKWHHVAAAIVRWARENHKETTTP